MKPKPILLTCQVGDAPMFRVATLESEKEIKPAISKDLLAMGETFGGLIEATSPKGRKYRAFKATWKELEI